MLSLRNIIFVFILSIFTINSHSQNIESDAINFGTNNNDGSARYVAVGGAMSAVGGDITNIRYNPAGIAVYKSSVIVLSPSYEINKSNTIFLNSSRQSLDSRFYLSNIGAVFSMKNNQFSLFRSFNIGLAMNSLNNYNTKNYFKQNADYSITHNWVNEANVINGNQDLEFGYDKFSFETVGAYNTWLVNFDTLDMAYHSPIISNVSQKRSVIIKGGKKDYGMSFGTNILDKIFLGASVSLPYINYSRDTKFNETDINNGNGSFEKFELTQNLKTSGSGVNIKIGAIFKPVSILRLSASIQSQTRYNLTEEYTSDFITTFDTISYENKSSLGKFEYDLSTPWRANAGIALVHKKAGFISFDYEMVDYTSTRFHFEDAYKSYEEELNNNIKAKYKIAHNLKVGLESKIKKFRIRAGYAMQTSPLKTSFREGSFDFSRQQFSGGIGFLWKKVSLDASYRYTINKEYELSFDGVNGITKDNDTQLLIVTIGFKISK